MDDRRPAPLGWVLAKTVEAAKAVLKAGDLEAISLDHDLGACDACVASGASKGDFKTPSTTFDNWCPHVEDGHSLMIWMFNEELAPPSVSIHSKNPVGHARMRTVLDRFRPFKVK